MKKILASLLVLALCAPAMAATISLSDLGGGQAKITVDATADGVNIVGLGLDVDVTGGSVSAVSVDTANFNIFPDAAYSQELGGDYVYGTGSPVAAKTVPGQIDLPQSSFALSLGMLNGEAVAGADGAFTVEIVLQLGASATAIDVCENATRGGIVATDGSALDADCAHLDIVGGPCYTGPDLTEWQNLGSPASWCTDTQCHGDANNATEQIGKGFYSVGYQDINILLGGFATAYVDPVSSPWIAADFDHGQEQIGKGFYRVGYNDINVLLAWFANAGIPADCQTATPVSP